MSTEIAKAYVQIIPSTEGISGKLESALSPEASSAGASAGSILSSSLGKTFIAGFAALQIGKVVVNAVSSAISSGSEFQTSLAKLGTIADTSQKSMASFSDEIRVMSDEMGISQADLAESAYSVISATGDTANALDIVSASAKLATAGFTDTASATSVLSSIMNSYGLEASSVEHISDSLVTTQNLGVTTVADLASNMGRAISTASAYGVSLENLESAYIATTKGGISTAESTTYLSSMLTELGKEGSDVSNILQEQTGKSFGQLMDDGSSLGDVLGILYNSVGQDSEAFMNLWSSQEAGKAANTICQQGIDEFNDHLSQLQEQTGTTQTAYEEMMDTFSSKSSVLKTNLENIGIQFFNDIYPAIESCVGKLQEFVDGVDTSALSAKIEEVATKFGDWVTNLDADTIVSGIDTVVNACVGLINIISNVVQFFGYIGQCIQAVGDIAGAVFDAIGNGVSGAVEAGQNGFQSIHDSIDGVMSSIPGIGELWTTMGEANLDVAEQSASAMESSAQRSKDAVSSATSEATSEAQSSMDTLNSLVDSATSEAKESISSVNGTTEEAVTATTEQMNQLSETASATLASVQETSGALGDLSSSMATSMNNVVSAVKSAMTSAKNAVESGCNSIKTSVNTKVSELQTSVTTGFNTLNNNVKSSMSTLQSNVTNTMNNCVSAVKSGVNSMKNALNVTMPTPYIKMPHITVSGSFSIEKGTAPTFSCSWYDKGGIFSSPTIIGVGEKRPEFVGALDDLRGIVRDESGVGSRDSLEALRAEVRAFRQEIAESNIMLDSGELVGAIVTDIDRALGQRLAYTRAVRA